MGRGVPLDRGDAAWLALIRVSYTEGEGETYALPIAFATGAEARRIRRETPAAVIADLQAGGTRGLLHGAEGDPDFARALLEAIRGGGVFEGQSGQILASKTSALDSRMAGAMDRDPALLSAEQSNSSIRFGDALILKLFRKVEAGINPDLEVGAFLTESARFEHTAPVCGQVEYRPARGASTTLAILQGFVPNEGDAWRYTLDSVGRFFEAVAARPEGRRPAPDTTGSLLELARRRPPALARAVAGPSLDAAALLGRRTAEMHRALASDASDPAFAPEPFSRLDQRGLYQSQRNLAEDVFELLRRRLPELRGAVREQADHVLSRRPSVLARFRRLLERKLAAVRTRTHGDYHLGQVLWTGRDFVIIDFEGEPARPASVRRAKRSPLRDVAGMVRSYHYAAYQGLATFTAAGAVAPGQQDVAESWARAWYGWVSGAFLGAYLEVAAGAPFVPRDDGELEDLLVVHVLDKAVYELGYELNNRPDWVRLPLQGIAALVGDEEG